MSTYVFCAIIIYLEITNRSNDMNFIRPNRYVFFTTTFKFASSVVLSIHIIFLLKSNTTSTIAYTTHVFYTLTFIFNG
jgi:hypothetical protein